VRIIVSIVPPLDEEKLSRLSAYGKVVSWGRLIPYVVMDVEKEKILEIIRLPFVTGVQEDIWFKAQQVEMFFRK